MDRLQLYLEPTLGMFLPLKIQKSGVLLGYPLSSVFPVIFHPFLRKDSGWSIFIFYSILPISNRNSLKCLVGVDTTLPKFLSLIQIFL